jgi:hypothetical protein
VFQEQYTNRPASQSCSGLPKAILKELSDYCWESCKGNPIGAARWCPGPDTTFQTRKSDFLRLVSPMILARFLGLDSGRKKTRRSGQSFHAIIGIRIVKDVLTLPSGITY